jgi:hypothetical protein
VWAGGVVDFVYVGVSVHGSTLHCMLPHTNRGMEVMRLNVYEGVLVTCSLL